MTSRPVYGSSWELNGDVEGCNSVVDITVTASDVRFIVVVIETELEKIGSTKSSKGLVATSLSIVRSLCEWKKKVEIFRDAVVTIPASNVRFSVIVIGITVGTIDSAKNVSKGTTATSRPVVESNFEWHNEAEGCRSAAGITITASHDVQSNVLGL